MYTLATKADQTYSIGAADQEIYKFSTQLTLKTGSTSSFCSTRVTATFTGLAGGDASYFNTDYDTTGILTAKVNTAIAAKTTAITVTAKLDGAAFATPLSQVFNLITKQECEPATWTAPAAQSAAENYYIGR